MNIVRMNETWVGSVAALEKKCFSEPWSEKALTETLGSPLYAYFVAEEDGELLGYGGVYFAADEADVTNIAVEPDARMRGVGRLLVRAVLSEAAERGAGSVYLEVRTGNAPAIRLYERCGFELVGIRRDFYQKPREDARIYCYRLREDSCG